MPSLLRKYVIDLFCGEGGVSRGLADAGFIPLGVDVNSERIGRYPYSAYYGDWEAGLSYWMSQFASEEIAFIWASPPCQGYSVASNMASARGFKLKYPRLIEPVREALISVKEFSGIDYVIENVPSSPLKDPVTLCGSFFGLQGTWRGDKVGLRRHRDLEASWKIETGDLDHYCDEIRNVPVYGHGAPGYRDGDPYFCGPGFAHLTREVMGIDWMSRRGLTEAIPPAYAKFAALEWYCYRNPSHLQAIKDRKLNDIPALNGF